jgi:hypothetical protein
MNPGHPARRRTTPARAADGKTAQPSGPRDEAA